MTTQSSIDGVARDNVVVLRAGSPDYPVSIGERTAFPALHVLGRTEPLQIEGIGLCGSRNAGDKAAAFARAVGAEATVLGIPLVSGYARGCDIAAHVAAIKAGGRTTAVLAEGISRFRVRRELAILAESQFDIGDSITVVSQFDPDARWTVINAMQRNKIICALSHLFVAIEPGEKGGTLNAAQEAIRQGKPLIVIHAGDCDAPRHVVNLVRRGATLVRDEGELADAIHRAFELAANPQPALFP